MSTKDNPHWGTTLNAFLLEERNRDLATGDQGSRMPALTLREALRQIWVAAKYPIRGNEDWRAAEAADAAALQLAGTALPTPDDPPEFAQWIAALRNPHLPDDEREDIMSAIYDLFEPDEG
jgi:hypothetical protein